MSFTAIEVDAWKKRIGLFPMPLFQNKFQTEKYILLNGSSKGNFCIDYSGDGEYESYRDYAWSSDVSHYLVVGDKNLSVIRWDNFRLENYALNKVERQLEDFYDYLKNQEVNKLDSIVKFGILLYRQIRTLLRDETGERALQALLYLLATVDENQSEKGKVDLKKWGLLQQSESIVTSIPNLEWYHLIEMFHHGLRSKGLKPDIGLLLRHASGSLFQETHFETLFPVEYQGYLPGFLPKIQKPKGIGSKQTSAHFTPTSIVRTIVEEILHGFDFSSKNTLTVFDPACGSGEFLKEFIRQTRINGYVGKIKIVGWDISQTAIDMANFIVSFEARSYPGKVEIDIIKKDALIGDWSIKPDFLLMNPPFVSWELMSIDDRNKVSDILATLSDNRPNTASAFIWNAINCLKDNGRIGCVLPTSIYDADSYTKLRETIFDIVKIRLVGKLGSHSLFSDALVDAALFIAEKSTGNNPQSPLILWSDFKTDSNATALRELRKLLYSRNVNYANGDGYSIYPMQGLSKDANWNPIAYESFDLLSSLKDFPKVKDLFDVRQGARTGLNSVFIIPKDYLVKLPKREHKYFRPAITNDSINNGCLNDNYYIFFPYGSKIDEIQSEKELKELLPNFYTNFLQPNLKRLLDRKGMKEWWDLTRPRNWQKAYSSKIVSTEFGKAGAFAFDQEGIYVCERSHAWFPKKTENFSDDIGYAYITVLSMPLVDKILNGVSKQIGGGQWYLASKYINEMPIPDLFEVFTTQPDIINEMSALGRKLSNGEKIEIENLDRFSRIIYGR